LSQKPIPAIPECPVNSNNEWDLLEEVIVGSPAGACASFWDPIDKMIYTREEIAEIEKYVSLYRPYPDHYIQSACKALNNFVHILEAEGVSVNRVDEVDYSREFGNPFWKTPSGFCAANPRDTILVIGNQIIEAPMCSRSRYFETLGYQRLLATYFQDGVKWVAAPKPMLTDELFNPDFRNPHSPTTYVLTEAEPVFDAADFVRCGRDIIGQLSHVTNRRGVEWLQSYLGDDFRIHLIQSMDPKPAHIDTTLMPLAAGKVLVNPTFTDIKKLPSIFKTWDVLIAPEPVPYKTRPRLMSNWISINTLVLDGQRIIVEERQEPLIKALKSWGFKPITCAFEDYYPFIGGFHCATLDIRRQGELKSYF